MTEQEIFDTACAALLEQGCRSVEEGGGFCMFRGPKGTKCAVGHLIPDEDYADTFDITSGQGGIGNSGTLELYAEKLGVNFHFLRDLQKCHDNARGDFIPEFTTAAFKFAHHYGLNTDVLGQPA